MVIETRGNKTPYLQEDNRAGKDKRGNQGKLQIKKNPA